MTQEEINRIVAQVPGGAGNVQDIYPLAPLQEGILFHHLMGGDGDPYLLALQYQVDTRERLQGRLAAMQSVVDRHDILRTAVVWEGLREPVQVVWRRAVLPVEEVELEADAGDAARQLYERFNPRQYRIDVRQAPMMRVCIAEDKTNRRWLMIHFLHHLIADHVTIGLFQEEVQAHLLGEANRLPAPLPFRNLIAQARLGVSREEHEAYFRRLLGDVEEATAPFGLLNVQGDGRGIEEARMRVDAALARRLRERARKLRVSAASVCHVAWAQVLARVSGRQDVVFGTVLFGRMQGGAGADRVMGLFTNMLPVRLRVGDKGAEATVRRMHGQLADLMRHEHASLALAQRCSGVPAPAPLFSSLLNYRHSVGRAPAHVAEARRAWEGVEGLYGEERTNYPVTLSMDDLGEGFGLTAQVEAGIGAKRICEYMHRALEGLVEALESEPGRAVRRLEVLPEQERRKVLYEWNDTGVEYPTGKCIHELFEEQVERAPDAVAVVYEEASLSYGELNRRANQLAHYLREVGVGPDARVAICVERGFEMIEALLGVLKAGGAYVPLDPAYPGERLSYMLQDSGAVALLTQGDLAGWVQARGDLPVIDLNERARWQQQPESNPASGSIGLSPRHLAYVIYTSGSTGTPKGVMVEHRSLDNLIYWHTNAFSLKCGKRSSSVAGFGFDAATWEMWPTLCAGAVLLVASIADTHNHQRLVAWWAKQMLDISFLPTPLAELIFMHDSTNISLQTLLIGGDRLHRLPGKLLPFSLFNNYGPTEATVVATSCHLQPRSTIAPIGRPIANTRVYILDGNREPVPVGVSGELYIGGAGVARGYLNRPELTEERFLKDPFVADGQARMYKTGDLGRWLEDGNIEFLGRNDFQVKIRGFRIELGEIEARLAECAGVREVAVVAREDTAGDKRLVAYYTGAEGDETAGGAEVWRTQLSAKLPEYMVPAAYVRLEKLPLTPNGKLDRKALPAPEADAYATRGYEAPQTETEEALAGIWAEVLKLDRVGRNDNFFDLGGHSLLAVTVIERMQRRGMKVGVRELFKTPTLAGLAAFVGREETIIEIPPNRIEEGCELITPEMLTLVELTAEEIGLIAGQVPGGAGNVQDIYPLAPMQEGVLFHHLMGRNGDPYLLAVECSFDTRTRLEGYLGALQSVVDRHDILRTAVVWEGLREPAQVVWRRAVLPVEEVELEADAGDGAGQLYERFNPRQYRMDLRQAPMMRVCIAEDKTNRRWLMIHFLHHLIADHTTSDLMNEEVQAHLLGEADRLPAPLPFRNLIAQARLGVSREEHEAYFRRLLGDVEEATAPFGLLNVQGDGRGIEEARMRVDAALARRLRERARKLEVSAASVCHVAWAQVLARVSGRQDVVFGTVLFGRMQGGAGADRVMGLFTNMLPVRTRVGDEGAEATVRRMHGQLADLMRHEHASLALAQRCSGVPAPAPLFSAGLNYRHSVGRAPARVAKAKRAWGGIQWLYAEERSNYPFGLLVDDLGEGFGLTAQVEAGIGAKRICEYMHRALEGLVEALESEPGRAVRRLEVLPEQERRKVLYEWNDTGVEYPTGKCIHELFEEQVERAPDAVAVVYEEASLSYGELNRRANQLAHYLREVGVGPDARVAICVERGFEMIEALLGVLKAGGAYVPLDPAYPGERLSYMLQDSGAVALLTQGDLAGWVQARGDLPVIDLNERARWQQQPESNPASGSIGLSPRHLAYVIYTSGSTGTPKGVMVEHSGLCNLVSALMKGYAIKPESRILQFASFSFDACVPEIFGAICRGAIVHVGWRSWGPIDEITTQRIVRDGISHMTLPPALLRVWPENANMDLIETLIVAGEALSESSVERWRGGRQLINAYGPTEATVCATMYDCPADQSSPPPIGRPIANTRVYILDGNREPVPVGVSGELYIGGAGVARGYLNRPELTEERFLKDPFVADGQARMYKTGDLGRWLEDGNIEFLGRNDFQVKIRGFRIELGEIEARLAECAGVREVAVVAREDTAGDKRLVAYYTGAEGDETAGGAEVWRTQLSAKLPEYMVPAAYVRLEKLPLTPNGKLDRKALPAPEADAYATRGYEAPQTETEEALAGIWAEVLKLDRVGRNDNFFDLGGHSLLAVTVIERMQRRGMKVDVGDLFITPTLAELAAFVGREETIIEIPPNRIEEGCELITPEMLTLVELTAEEIGLIAGQVPGGAGNVQDIYPLAPMQEGILFHHLMGGETDPYVSAFLFTFDTRERLEGYLGALQSVVDRHDILRTAVVWEGLREPAQVVWRRAALPVEEVELETDAGDGARQLYERFNPRQYRMDVRQAPMMHVCIAEDKTNRRWLMMRLLHHLIEDNTSARMLNEEVQAYLLGEADRLPAPLPFRNLIAQARLGVSREEHEAYFRRLLGDVEEATAPFGLLNVQGDGRGIEEARMRVDAVLARRLRERARKLEVSAASVCHVAWAQVLARVSGRQDVVFGTVLFGRMGGAGADRAVGLFTNMLPVRLRVGDEGAEAIVRRMHGQLADLMRHEHASLALAQRCSGVPAPAPLFSSLLNYRHSVRLTPARVAEAKRAWEGVEGLYGEERTNYPVTLSMDDLGEGFGLTAQVEAGIGAKRICEYMHRALEGLVEALESEPGRAVRRLEVLPEQERRKVLYEWNDTGVEYPTGKCIHELFEEQVERAPDAVAVVYEEASLSYGELNRRANQLAHYLREVGVGPDARVAICVERGFEMIEALLGVLKAGGAYVPLDPAYPGERLSYMLQDSGAVALLTQGDLAGWVQARGDLPVIDLNERARWQQQPESNPASGSIGLSPRHLAYVIYTSGSTGIPKGVMVEHRNVVRLFAATEAWFQFNANDVWTLFHSYAFDFSVWELWGALFYGASLILVGAETVRSPEEFYRLVCQARVTILNQTPSAFKQLTAAQASNTEAHCLRQIIFGGEAFDTAALSAWYLNKQNDDTHLINMYGITETTVHVTYQAFTQAVGRGSVGSPIGRRIPDTRVYILDGNREPVPVGVSGELYIGGAGVARGYLNRPELTEERFLKDPFVADGQARMYKTGDLGRWLEDGNIEFLGRNDFQVKIRGFRIELGEIEARLAECAGVREVAVVAREDTAGEKRLVAYYTGAEGDETVGGAEVWRTQLSAKLPEYMVPAAYVRLEKLPLTPNGKLDRKALPAPEADAYATRGYEAPQTETEEALAGIWAEVLKLDRVGRNDNFFDLGGHSLLAVTVIERMQRRGMKVGVRELFKTPTLAGLAAFVGREETIIEIPPNRIEEGCELITPEMLTLVELTAEEIGLIAGQVPGGAGNVQDIYPLAPMQEGILFHHLMGGETDPYVSAFLFTFDTRERLEGYLGALQSVVDRHDILRTAVVWEGLREPAQVVWRRAALPVEEVELETDAGDGARQLYERFNPRQYRMDVRQAPMMHVCIAEDKTNRRWLMMRLLHHLIEDNTSARMLNEEVQAYLLGEADRLPAPLPFRNLIAQARLGVSREEHEAYFRRLLGDVEEATAPFGLLNVQGDGRGIEEARMRVDAALARRLRERARKLEVSAASVCHVAWAQVLARVSGRQDVVFGTVLFGRMGGAGADRAVGLFTNMLPVRLRVGDEGAEAIVRRMHGQLADLMRHEHASLALAQRCSGVPAPAPLFSSLLNYRHSVGRAPARVAEAKRAWEGVEGLYGEERTNYPVTLSMDDLGEGFGLTAQVEAGIGAKRICEYMHRALEGLVEALESEPGRAVRRLEVLPEQERRKVLYEWNDTGVEYPTGKCIHELFEEQVERAPDAVAVVYEEASLSYGELNRRANQLAHYLREVGVGPDARVAICVERGFEMIEALLGVLKAGGAYVPLDPAYPGERLSYMLQDSGAVALLTQGDLAGWVQARGDLPVIDLNERARWQQQPESNPASGSIGLSPRHLAYVIYTSGSTGIPKGVMVEHRSLVNRLVWMQSAYVLDSNDAILQKTPFSFDVSVWEFFWPLLTGTRLVIARPEGHRDSTYLCHTIRRNSITTIHFVPAMFEVFLQQSEVSECSSLTHIVCSGEALAATLARKTRGLLSGSLLHNLYGPTEATVDVTAWTCASGATPIEDRVPIGRPIANTRVYILDGNREPVPVGVSGELYIGGAGVARGYLNRPELTEERFLKDPFVADGQARMYKTGDLGRWLEDGNIEFLGRNDFQVKIRGFRIELGEIEARLAECAGVREVAVVAREDTAGDKRLVAYYTGAEGDETAGGAEVWRTQLSAKLPEYMVPAAYVRLEKLPLTPNGKLDRKALPAPEADAYATRGYEAPQTETEEALAGIWAEVLKLDRVGRNDNFFDLGGHSLLAVRLIARLQQALNAEVTIRDIFAHPVLADLAHRVENAGRMKLPPITRAVREERIPLSFAQQRLWFLAQMEGVSEAYHIPFGLRLRGVLDRTALRRALDRIVARHEVLRTALVFVEGEPVQRIGSVEESHFHLVEHDVSRHAVARDELGRLRVEETRTSFDLAAGPLIRGRLIREGEQEHVLLITMHHIVSDGWSIGVLLRELSTLYGAYVRGEADPLPELRVQYADYAVWQRKWMEGEILRRQADYWKTALGGAPALLELPADYVRPGQQDYAGAFAAVALDEELTAGLKALSKRHGTTLFMTLLAGWAALLARLSGQEEVVIGTAVANRGRLETEGLIGFFVNTLALRVDISGAPTVSELLGRVKMQSIDAQQHQDIPFEQVVELIRPVRSLSHSPLFQVMFDWQNALEGRVEFSGVELRPLDAAPHVTAKSDLNLSLREAGGRIVGGMEYATSLFKRSTVERYWGYFRKLLEGMAGGDSEVVERLPLLTPEERERVLYEWNDTGVEYPTGKCIHELFEEQVERAPDAVAVVYEEASLSYGELNRRANQLAHYLREVGVGPDARVAICVERGFEMIEALLGVLKAGGAYVPLDPAYPGERLSYMLQDSGAVALLTQGDLAGWVQARGDLPVIDLNERARWQQQPESNPASGSIGLSPRHLAYVIYTSGSTGIPKGVMVEHRNVVSFLSAMRVELAVGSDDELLTVTTLSFDIAALELYVPLAAGARVKMPSRHVATDGALLRRELQDGVTIMQATPVMWRMLLESGWDGSSRLKVLCGGETLSADLAGSLRSRVASAWNMYGPTETTIWSLTAAISTMTPIEDRVPIGRPIANTRVYILDGNREPVPMGVSGELYIGGAGVARGYLNRPELTEERFLKDPFVADGQARMYKTGDLGRWLEDGNIEFLGRNDFQVKIRGFRIELGEIEARLAECAGVREVAVVAREDTAGDKRLVAYYTGAEGDETAGGAEVWRTQLSAKLPEYMVPAAYVRLEKLPLTPNGKLDRKALPAPEADAYATRGYEAPQTETEEALAGIWAEVLKLDRVGRNDNFFDLGGHSLLAVRLIARLQQALNAEVTIRDIFAHPVLADLAHRVENAGRMKLPPITRAVREERIPLSFAQQRLWFLAQMEGVSEAYHIPFGLRLRGVLDRTALRRALDRIVARHEVLRTALVFVEGEPVQRIGSVEESHFHLVEHDVSRHAVARDELGRLRVEETRTSFDLAAGPLIRGRLIREGEQEHVLLITMHHIVSDGWSIGVLLRELSTLYGAYVRGEADPLPELRVQYADYAVWQRKWMEGEILRRQADYWKTALGGAPALLELPADYVRPGQQDYAGAFAAVALDEELTAGLKALSKRHGTTLFMTLLAGWAALLARLSGQEEVVIGTAVANRGRLETEGLIGFFVNTLALRVDISGAPTVSELLGRVKMQSIDAQQHQDIPFEQVVELIRPVRSLSHSPLFQVMFDWQNALEGRVEFSGVELRPLDAAPHVTAKSDLNLSLREAGGRIVGGMEYATSLFKRSTVERYWGYFRKLLEGMAGGDSEVVERLPLLTPEERERVLYEWNDTGVEYPTGKCIHELFEEQVERAPDAVAVVYEEASLSYGELNRRANQLAHYLREVGVGPDARVAICVERGFEMIEALLGVLKAGGAYVPLDPAYPGERLSYMLQDSGAVALLTQGDLAGWVQARGDLPVIDLNERARWQQQPESNPASGSIGLSPRHLAYVIYTSGSTGIPKGVMVEHRSFRNYLTWALDFYHPVGAIVSSSLSFDGTITSLYTALFRGGTAHLLREGEEIDGLCDELRSTERCCGLVKATPGHLDAVGRRMTLEGVQTAGSVFVIGGEVLSPTTVRLWRQIQPDLRLVNEYGPTETVVGCLVYDIGASFNFTNSIPIGRPIANTRVYILDGNREPVPVGVSGELYIGGAGVARGYLNRPELTEERFLKDPFVADGQARMYKTGDLGRWLEDGNIEFLGRNDFQVKIRGFRIELGEIEARLAECAGVREVAVVAREDTAGDKRLVAYYTGAEGDETAGGAEVWRTQLSAKLPEYMVPAAYVRLEKLPLTPNGKLDRKALPAPEADAYATRGYEAPQTETEEALAGIWAEVLKLDRVGRNDNFFDLGGHSLLAVTVIERMARVGLQMDIGSLFNMPTLGELAATVRSANKFEEIQSDRMGTTNKLDLHDDAVSPQMYLRI